MGEGRGRGGGGREEILVKTLSHQSVLIRGVASFQVIQCVPKYAS